MPKKVEIERIAWSKQAEEKLHGALDSFEMAIVASQVKRGICELWRVGDGFVVTRTEIRDTGDMLIIVAGEGKGLTSLTPVLDEICRVNNITVVKLHTGKNGVVKLMEKHGFVIDEFIMKWEPE